MAQSTWIYKIQPARVEMLAEGSTPEEERLISEHFQYLKRLTGEGVVLLAGRTLNTDTSSFGIVIFKAADEKAAREIFQDDPAVRASVFKGQVFPFSVALLGEK